MKLALLLTGLYLTYASEGLLGGDDHDLVDHAEVAQEEDTEASIEGDDEEENILGDEVDAYGCITTAGYTWCEQLEECVQLFEEACVEETILTGDETDIDTIILGPEDDSTDAADAGSWFGGDEDYMSHGDGFVGGDEDENGCLGSAGYTWCEKQNDCVRSWELEGEWEDECITETMSSDSSGESSSESSEDEFEKFFFNEDGTFKPWCLLGLSITVTILLLCMVRARSIRKRRRQRTRSAGVMLVESRDNYARFNSHESNITFQETVAVREATKDAVPSRKEFINLV